MHRELFFVLGRLSRVLREIFFTEYDKELLRVHR